MATARPLAILRGQLRLFGEKTVTISDGGSDVDDLAIGGAGLIAQHVDGARLVDQMAFHQDALGPLSNGASPKRALDSWYSAKRHSTMSIELCQSSASASVM